MHARETNKKTLREEPNTRNKSTEIVHTNVCGPIEPFTWDGNRYYITFLDNFTHHTSVYLMRGKYEVSERIEEYIEEAEAKWNTKFSQLRCDNSTEYTNEKVKLYCRRKGIRINHTTPYTPQQNGRAEQDING
ncbi:hypothetical protein RF55_11692 [Lasius niger]|uniref:Integrase catalytic domain-containing protein n=1 Tax=Lasius niger TaxID=67767 RepID=A0A0J7KER8_LASNI|nr:hypothetical protein RF55_11692 [Lasius niger]